MITMILPADLAWGIGNSATKNGFPWKSIREDFDHFVQETKAIGKMVSGSETARAILKYRKGEPLPDREWYMLSRKLKDPPHPNIQVFDSIQKIEKHLQGKDYAVIGGAKTYTAYAPLADRIILTIVHDIHKADCWFDPYILLNFDKVEEKIIREQTREKSMVTVQYYERKKAL